MRAAGKTRPPKDMNVPYSLMSPEPPSIHDALLRRWCQEEAEHCPPRLCHRDLEQPERFHLRLEAWIRKQC